MIIIYLQSQFVEITDENQDLIEDAIWVDLLNPTKKEEKLIENLLNIDVPTRQEMVEIEPSSRLYLEDDCLFMTAIMVAKSDTRAPVTDSVTFILTEKKLITVRYIEPHAFKSFIARLLREKRKEYNAKKILFGLLEAATDRLADILENVSHEFDKISYSIFHANDKDLPTAKVDYKKLLQKIGANGDLSTKVRESLVSFLRLSSFLEQTPEASLDSLLLSRLAIVNKDIMALSDYAGFIATKVNFLVEATLGMVNIEQNNIIKIFSVAAVIFLPPTLIASIHGMNFEFMPELHWRFGYPMSVGLMIISAIMPYLYFKWRRWL